MQLSQRMITFGYPTAHVQLVVKALFLSKLHAKDLWRLWQRVPAERGTNRAVTNPPVTDFSNTNLPDANLLNTNLFKSNCSVTNRSITILFVAEALTSDASPRSF